MDRTFYCPYCEEKAELVGGDVIYPHRKDLKNREFWYCANCDAYVGTHRHSGGKPLGTLANAELRIERSKVHKAFDPLWRGKKRSRQSAYKWLAEELNIDVGKCHIGMFDLSLCKRALIVLDK